VPGRAAIGGCEGPVCPEGPVAPPVRGALPRRRAVPPSGRCAPGSSGEGRSRSGWVWPGHRPLPDAPHGVARGRGRPEERGTCGCGAAESRGWAGRDLGVREGTRTKAANVTES